MKTDMEAITAHPSDKEQLKALEIILKAMKVPFEKTKSHYKPEFVAMVEQADKDFKAGKGKKVSIEELNDLWK